MGLNFRLPSEFRKFNVSGADILYSTPDVDFEVQVMSKEKFESDSVEDGGLGLNFNMTVREYTEFLMDLNEWCDPSKEEQYRYDETRDAATFYIFWTPDLELFPYSYYYFTVMKSEVAFYVTIFTCLEEKYPEYEEKFRAWSTYINIGY
jgi:hypothetical protein